MNVEHERTIAEILARQGQITGKDQSVASRHRYGHHWPKADTIEFGIGSKQRAAFFLAALGFTDVSFRFWGIVETCIAVESTRPALIGAKRAWNRAGLFAQGFGLPNMMSELQVTARLSTQTAAGA